MKNKAKKILLSLITLTAVCIAVLYLYSIDYYHADAKALSAAESTAQISVEITDNMAIFRPENAEAGFIFYPGGKVEYTAYAPLMHKLAENNIACIITKMPFNLAVLDTDAADKAYERIADRCSNIAVEVLQVSEGKLEAHEYLNALKAGELHESAKFADRFAKYRAQYSFPDEE